MADEKQSKKRQRLTPLSALDNKFNFASLDGRQTSEQRLLQIEQVLNEICRRLKIVTQAAEIRPLDVKDLHPGEICTYTFAEALRAQGADDEANDGGDPPVANESGNLEVDLGILLEGSPQDSRRTMLGLRAELELGLRNELDPKDGNTLVVTILGMSFEPTLLLPVIDAAGGREDFYQKGVALLEAFDPVWRDRQDKIDKAAKEKAVSSGMGAAPKPLHPPPPKFEIDADLMKLALAYGEAGALLQKNVAVKSAAPASRFVQDSPQEDPCAFHYETAAKLVPAQDKGLAAPPPPDYQTFFEAFAGTWFALQGGAGLFGYVSHVALMVQKMLGAQEIDPDSGIREAPPPNALRRLDARIFTARARLRFITTSPQ